jgi:predicted kinase
MNLKELKEPFVIFLVGAPLVGKSTFIRENFEGINVISRDEILMEVAGTRDYTEAWKNVDQKSVDVLLSERLRDSNKGNINTIIDMTNLTRKSRVGKLNVFSKDFLKVAVVFKNLSDDEFDRRNENRRVNENKFIPIFVIKNMISSYVEPTLTEGFDEIVIL